MKGFKKTGKAFLAVGLAAVSVLSAPVAQAAGDLLVAPTRVIFDGRRGAEVILNNVGDEESTYRISLELRRMDENGKLQDVPDGESNEKEDAVKSIIRYAPRRVTLPPNQPQAIRLAVRGLEALDDGEYRAHMLFQGIPKTQAVTEAPTKATGVSIQLIPVYGVTIPVIIRKGKLSATASISNPRLLNDAGRDVLSFDIGREGNKSVYGEIRVTKAGVADPIVYAKGVSVYPELNNRKVFLPLRPEQAAAVKGPVTISYYEAPAAGGGLIAEITTVLQ